MEEEQEDLGAGTPQVRTRYDEDRGVWLWRVATDVEKALAKAVGIPVHKLYMNGEHDGEV